MPLSATATPSIDITYTLVQTEGDTVVSETASVGYTDLSYVNGTSGLGNIDVGLTQTGTIPANGTVVLDFSSLSKSVLGGSFPVNFAQHYAGTVPLHVTANCVRGLVITNTWSHPSGTGLPSDFSLRNLPYFTIAATGSAGFSGLFNGESGNIKVMPSSTWAFTDYVGVAPIYGHADHNRSEITLKDSGSGVPYQIVVVGVTGLVGF